MKVLKTVFYTLFLGFNNILIAQNFVTGTIISNQNDTMVGLINYENWEINPKTIEFKKNVHSKIEIHSTSSIKGFLVQNEIYVRADVSYNITSRNLQSLSSDPNPVMTQATVWLALLVEGDLSLYYLRDEMDLPHYFIKNKDKIEELIQVMYLKTPEQLATYDKYKATLMNSMKNCPKTALKPLEMPYEGKAFTDLIQSYNIHCGQQQTYLKKQEHSKIQYGVIMGIGIHQLSFTAAPATAELWHFLTNGKVRWSLVYDLGGKIDYISARGFGRWIFSNELTFKSYRSQITANQFVSTDEHLLTNSYFTVHAATLNTLLKYRIGTNGHQGLRYHVIFGAGGVYQSVTQNKRLSARHFAGSTTYEEKIAIAATTSGGTLGILGAGVQHKSMNVELRYLFGANISNLISLKASTQAYMLRLGYNF